ncbi:MAG: hypothetical protein HY332_08935 [Chloroflexi bacterium]|nr:hypothetical protein [Chloroflexota bacterium]
MTVFQDQPGPLWHAYRLWRAAAGPFADYVLVAPFLAGWQPVSRFPVHRDAAGVTRGIGARADRDAVAVLLEATPRLALSIGARLQRYGWAVVPFFGRWPAERAVLPVERLTGWLAGAAAAFVATGPSGDVPIELRGSTERPSRRCRSLFPAREGGRGVSSRLDPPVQVCFLLDSDRRRTVTPLTLRTRFDNRYDYAEHMLPPAEYLWRWGVTRTVWVGRAATPPPDLDTYAHSLIAHGLTVELAPLAALIAPERGAQYADRLPPEHHPSTV